MYTFTAYKGKQIATIPDLESLADAISRSNKYIYLGWSVESINDSETGCVVKIIEADAMRLASL